MKEKKMFRPRSFGWGLTPQTVGGWLSTLVFLLVTVIPFTVMISGQPRHQFTVVTIFAMVYLLGWVIAACIFSYYYLKKNYPKG